MNIVNIKLFKNTSDDIELFNIIPANVQVLNTLLQKAEEASAIRVKKDTDLLARQAVSALINAPNGLTRGELLLAADCDSIMSITQKIRSYLKKDNIYTLKKYRKGEMITYRLEKITTSQSEHTAV